MADHQPDRWDELLREAALAGAGQAQRIAELCVEMLDVTGAGISLASDSGTRGVICATDDVAMRIEEMQVTLGEGPCIDAMTAGGPVLVPDLDSRQDLSPDRWPAFLAGVASAGVRAVFAIPLRIGLISLGAMDLYRDRPGPLRDGELGGALLAAEAAGLALLSLQTSDDGGLRVDDDGKAFQSQVHQATGMVMVQAGVTIEQAFLLLRARAFASGRPLSAVAADVVGRRLRFDSEDL
jgi:hypothetical protein